MLGLFFDSQTTATNGHHPARTIGTGAFRHARIIERRNRTMDRLTGLLTQTEAAARLRVSPRTLRRWAQLGEIEPPVKIGRNAYYRPEDIRRFIAGKFGESWG